MTPEQIYKANVNQSHESALDAVFNAGVTIGMAKMADAVIAQNTPQDPIVIETKEYSDGTTATGTPPLPDASPSSSEPQ